MKHEARKNPMDMSSYIHILIASFTRGLTYCTQRGGYVPLLSIVGC